MVGLMLPIDVYLFMRLEGYYRLKIDLHFEFLE